MQYEYTLLNYIADSVDYVLYAFCVLLLLYIARVEYERRQDKDD